MEIRQDEGFSVYLRPTHHESAEQAEELLEVCATYEEARKVREHYHTSGCDCVIRYQGEVGGGD